MAAFPQEAGILVEWRYAMKCLRNTPLPAFGLACCLVFISFALIRCGGGGGGGDSAPSTPNEGFTQADLTGTWDYYSFQSSSATGSGGAG